MKSKYIVWCESGYNEAAGGFVRSIVKRFKNEPEALAFVSDTKNIRAHGEMFLERHDSNGSTYGWDAVHMKWNQQEE